jgi:uncharacterized membrane protein
MASPASIAKHPIHPMLIVFPVGLWVFSLVCDVVFHMGWGGPSWNDAAFYSMAGGIVGALLAAIPGFIDFFSIPSSQQSLKKLGWAHMVINLGAVIIFAIDLWWRVGKTTGSSGPMVLSIVGVLSLVASGWLGGSMVYEHGMAVDLQENMSREEERRAA